MSIMHCFGVVWVINLFSLSGFFGMFGTFGRSSKQTGPPAKKIPEVPGLRSLELIGDLIGHSGAVQVRYEDHVTQTHGCRRLRFFQLVL